MWRHGGYSRNPAGSSEAEGTGETPSPPHRKALGPGTPEVLALDSEKVTQV